MFRHLEVKDGLTHNQINHIYKDSEGYMWFSTASGLNRYDGCLVTSFRSYNFENGPLPDNYIYDVQETADKKLWVRTASGYCIYDPLTERFNREIREWMWGIGIDGVPAMAYVDSKKEMWFSMESKGICLYNPLDGSLVWMRPGPEGLPEGQVSNFSEYKDGILLLYTNGTVVCISKDNMAVKWRLEEVSRETGSGTDEFFTAFVDGDNDIWIFGPLGLWIYNPTLRKWNTELKEKISDPASKNMIRAIAQDIHGRIWIGKDQDGIDILDKRSGRICHLNNRINDERSLQNNTINAIYADPDRCMWVGTYKKGISYYNESTFKFDIRHVGDINCIEEDKDGYVWLGTNDAGLMRWNRMTGKTEAFTKSTPGTLTTDVVVCLLKTQAGKLWVGTFWGGLESYENGRFTHYANDPNNRNSLSHNNVWALVEDKKGNVWIGTLGGGVQCLNPTTGEFRTYNVSKSNLISDHVSTLCMTHNDHLLIGTSRGLSVLDIETGQVTSFTGTKSGQSFSNININHIYEDSRGLWWIATRELLNVYNPKTDELKILTTEDGLSNPFIAGIVEDNNKNMWISTVRGVTNVIVGTDRKNNEYTYRCHAYDDKDGLQNSEFNQRSIRKLSSGEILIGGLYGLNRFSPEEIKYNKILPNVIFTHLALFNEEVGIGQEYDDHVILQKALNHTERIELNYSQNIFSVGFSSDNYVVPEKMKYAYKLDGFNNEWMTTEEGKITYTNLAPGKYILKVKAINNDGYSSENEAVLTIVIHPPFWLSGWAYLLYAALFMLLLALARYILLRGERNKFKIRQIEQEALKNQEINDMKLRFFTNVSHELRTPLTLIISPLDMLIKEHETEDALADKLKMIRRNSIRLLNLVNQLLDFRKGDVKGHHLTPSDGDIVEFLDMACNSFTGLSEIKNVHLTFFSSVEALRVSFDADKMGKVIMNLLSNAFKFTHDGGRVDVSVDLLHEESQPELLEIRVSDTGVGIGDEDKARIFERFYQVDHPNVSGSGIGLSLVRDFVELHGGTVQVFDNVPAGCVFIIHLPVKRSEEKRESETAPITDNISSSPVILSEERVPEILHPDEVIRKKGKASAGNEDKRPMILVVDDNDDFLTFMYDSFSKPYRVKIATNGCEAWEMIPELMPDLIISDVMMPEMDGKELCRLVKSKKQTDHIPFILLSARQSTEHKLEGLTVGADDYITKPFNMDILSLRVKKLIDQKFGQTRNRINPEPSEIRITSLDEKLIENAVKYVEGNLSRSDFSVEELSRELGMSRVHLYKKLLAITNKTPIEFIRVIRLKRAAQLLRESQQNVSEIAYQVGFNNPKYFSKYFREEFGVLPSTYQEKEGR